MADPHRNFAYSTVATAPSPATSGTSLVVQAGDGAKFPSSGSFNATVWPASSQPSTANAEIVRVTSISTDTFTITRAQESTSARTIVVGDQIAATVTAKTLTDVELDRSYLTSTDQSVPTNTQAIYDDYLELAASFVYEVASGAELVVGSYATPLPLPDQNTNIFISVADETIPTNSEAIFSDFYELSAPFAIEAANGGVLQVGTGGSSGSVLAVAQYAPPSLVTFTVNTASPAALDTTNLAVFFQVPTSGAVVVRFSASATSPGAGPVLGFALLNHAGGTQVGYTIDNVTPVTSIQRWTVEWYLTGLTPGPIGLDIAAGTTTSSCSVFAQGHTGAVTNGTVGPALLIVQSL